MERYVGERSPTLDAELGERSPGPARLFPDVAEGVEQNRQQRVHMAERRALRRQAAPKAVRDEPIEDLRAIWSRSACGR